MSMLLLGAFISNITFACQLPKSYYKNVTCTSHPSYFLATKDSGLPVALLNPSGTPVIPLIQYERVNANHIASNLIPVQKNAKVGYINLQGKMVIPTQYDILPSTTSDGWSRAAFNHRIIVKKSGKFGIINTKNQTILPFSAEIDNISDYHQQKAKVTTTTQQTFWVDIKGKKLATKEIPPVTDTDKSLSQKNIQSNAIADFQPKLKEGKWGFVNQQGITVITHSFDEVMPFSQGLAGVRIGSHWGFINMAGDLVIPFRFDEAGVIREAKNPHDANTSSTQPTNQRSKPFIFYQNKAWIGNLNDGSQLCINLEGQNVDC